MEAQTFWMAGFVTSLLGKELSVLKNDVLDQVP